MDRKEPTVTVSGFSDHFRVGGEPLRLHREDAFGKKSFVYCTFQREGYHYFPGADENPEYAREDYLDVRHLGVRHMHYFNFKVWVQVSHDNRDIEFIQLRRRIIKEYESGSLEMDHKSCEMLANDLHSTLAEWYPGVEIRIDISEEGINGAYVEYIPFGG